MKQFFSIPPKAHMELSENGCNNLFALRQLMSDQSYYEYVEKSIKDGKFVIIDNGVGDIGHVATNEEMLDIALKLCPSEIIPLDVLGDGQKTVDNVIWMSEKFKEHGLIGKVGIFACPQGRTLDEWLDCYEKLVEVEGVTVIGMSKKAIPRILYNNPKDDQFIAASRNLIFSMLKTNNLLKKPLHFLGAGEPWEFELYIGEEMVRSTDSCFTIWQAMNGQDFENEEDYFRIPTPADYFERSLTQDEITLAKKNIETFKSKYLR